MDVTVKLQTPIEFKQHHFSELTIKKPRAKNLEAMDKHDGQVAKVNALIASCAGVPIDLIRELELDDYQRVAEVVQGWMGKSQENGEES